MPWVPMVTVRTRRLTDPALALVPAPAIEEGVMVLVLTGVIGGVGGSADGRIWIRDNAVDA